MKSTKVPWWVLPNFQLIGAEGPSDGGDGGSGGDAGDGNDGGDGGDNDQGSGDDGGDDGGDSGSGKEKDDEDNAGLKSALEKERRENARKDRELKRLQKLEADRADADKTEVQRAKDNETKATQRAERLANGFRNEKIDNAIRAAAAKANFHDADDAIMAVDREAISWEQDDDDPSKVKVDRKTVESAVKKVATAKPHLIKSGTSDNDRTGGQFGGGGGGGNGGQPTEQQYQDRYPALNN